MDSITGWLDKFFTNAASTAVDTYLQVVHWALRGITSLVFGQFRSTTVAWNVYYTDASYFTESVKIFAAAAHGAHGYTLQVRIPSVVRWASGGFSRLFSGWTLLARAVTALRAALDATVAAAVRTLAAWVLRSVYAPLAAYARKVYADLVKWGWLAWWWVTHLDKLAAAMIFHLAAAIEANAWQLAGILGKFALSLVLHNARRLALLAESIITAVV